MTKSFSVNLPLVYSLPIDKDLKRYFVKKFGKMVECNGIEFATEAVKSLRLLLMQYRADPNRHRNFHSYWSKVPFRKNWLLGKLFRYMDSHPHAVLAFLKFYLGDQPRVEDVKVSSLKHHQLLESVTPKVRSFRPLNQWLDLLFGSISLRRRRYYSSRKDPNDPFYRYTKYHDIGKWESYWRNWRRILISPDTSSYGKHSLKNYSTSLVPNPTFYSDRVKDKEFGHVTSKQFVKDTERFQSLVALGFQYDAPDSPSYGCLEWIKRNLPQDHDIRTSHVFDMRSLYMKRGKVAVGEIHHIPKPGTNERRPIAVPNRYIQFGLAPYQSFIAGILKNIRRDHTFDQRKSIRYVQNRLDNGHYTCSVDLSKATDLFPKFILDEFMDRLMAAKQWTGDLTLSKVLFDQVSRSYWINGDNLSQWKVGQPLGTAPSFGVLALGHHLLLESIALSQGYGHSPYIVLGDDVLLFTRRMRQAYIEATSKLHMPVSWHKSYEHNLVEFAGIVHIRNQVPRYIPDPKQITEYNLFDYQRNTGFDISYRYIPKDVKKWLTRRSKELPRNGTPLLKGDMIYQLATELYSAVYGSPRRSYMELTMGLIPTFITTLLEREGSPDKEFIPGWTVFQDYHGPVVRFIGRTESKMDPSTPLWKKAKFKPITTRAILQTTLATIRNSNPAH